LETDISKKETRLVMPTRIESGGDPRETRLSARPTQVAGTGMPSPSKQLLVGWLVVTSGSRQWEDFRIENPAKAEDRMLIGRDPTCTIRLDDSQVSERHASLRWRDGKLVLTDLDSTNGTFVNGKPTTKSELHDNDEIKVGDTTIKFKQL
jgi:pSer/pThr/pTyr-binding forkhead associated (FHA) protein